MGGEIIYQGEKYATHIENQIRAENSVPLRTHYGLAQNFDGSFSGTGDLLKGNESLYFKNTNVIKVPSTIQWSSFKDDGRNLPQTKIEIHTPFKYK